MTKKNKEIIKKRKWPCFRCLKTHDKETYRQLRWLNKAPNSMGGFRGQIEVDCRNCGELLEKVIFKEDPNSISIEDNLTSETRGEIKYNIATLTTP